VVGLLVRTIATPHLAYWDQVPGMLLMGLGLGLTVAPSNTDALARVGRAQRAHASGILRTFRQLGGTIGIAVLGAVVLGYQHSAPAAGVGPTQHAADAIATGFAAATAVFAVGLVAGWFLLPRGRAATTDRPAAWE
jgi:hypothetical protein